MTEPRRYELHAVDGRPLPVALRYEDDRCVVTAGTLVLVDDVSAFGDGRVEWQLVGRIEGMPGPDGVEVIFQCVEEFDRLDAHHLTIPGGVHGRPRAPELVATHGADGLELAPVAPDARAGVVQRLFGARRWQFRAAG